MLLAPPSRWQIVAWAPFRPLASAWLVRWVELRADVPKEAVNTSGQLKAGHTFENEIELVRARAMLRGHSYANGRVVQVKIAAAHISRSAQAPLQHGEPNSQLEF